MAPKQRRWGVASRTKAGQAAPAPEPEKTVLEVRQRCLELTEPDCTCALLENYFTIGECKRYMEVLRDDIDWQRQEVTLSSIPRDDKTVKEPRMTLFMSDPGVCYSYSGRDNVGVEWTAELLEIKAKAEQGLRDCGVESVVFNSVQMNRYNHPRHTLGLHRDNEPDLARNVPIASVSFGSPRDFVIRHGKNAEEEHVLTLADGSFCVMAGAMQLKYLHGIPEGERGLRFNLTFRVCIPRDAPRAALATSRPRPGNWECQQCGADNFASRARCLDCGAQRPVDSAPASADRGQGKSSKGKGKTKAKDEAPVERRVDPDDKKSYTHEELLQKYKGQYRDVEIHDYWKDVCRPIP